MAINNQITFSAILDLQKKASILPYRGLIFDECYAVNLAY